MGSVRGFGRMHEGIGQSLWICADIRMELGYANVHGEMWSQHQQEQGQ